MGSSLERTLAEMSTEAGGFLLQEDIPWVLDEANALLSIGGGRQGKYAEE